MGAKTGYADVILRCMGLRPGQGAEHYLWCEPDAGVRLLLHAYRDRELATAAADIIRGWKDEDPRALWLRLRAEGPAVCPPVDPREVARWAWIAGYAYNNLPVWDHGEGLKMGYHRGPSNEWREQEARSKSGNCETGVQSPAFMVDRFRALPAIPASFTADAREVDPPRLPPGVVVYVDPPYENCTGYGHPFPRGAWLPVVRQWRDAGALVVVSEAEPIPELVADGWHAVRIDGERRGQKRTFSKQQAEWLTMSEPPRWRPSVQAPLFG